MRLIPLLLLFASLAHADITGRVVAVTDGDTTKVLDANNTQHKVRLTGIDAPKKKQPFGKASKEHLASEVGRIARPESTNEFFAYA
jgi:endonuclease YncB( thermonuclease family)